MRRAPALSRLVLVLGCVAWLPGSAGAYLSLVDVLENPSSSPNSIAMSPDGLDIYGTLLFNGLLIGVRRDPGTGAMKLGLILQGPAAGYAGVLPSPDGSYVYAGLADHSGLALLRRDAATGLLEPVDVLAGIGGLVLSPDGRFGYGYGGEGGIRTLARDPATGRFADVAAQPPAHGYVLTISPDGATLYAVSSQQEVLVYQRDPLTGALVLIQTFPNLGYVRGVSIASGVVSPDGRSLYAGTYDPGSPLFAFRREADGTIALVQRIGPLFGGTIRAASLLVSPDSSVVYAGGSVAVLHRSATSGSLMQVQGIGGDFPTISPDGRDVYALVPSGLAHFRRDCGDGVLGASESCDDGNLVDGDGCSSACTQEPCWTCAGAPSICATVDQAPCDDGNQCTADGHCSAGACVPGPVLPDGTACDDGDACSTGDACANGACVGPSDVTCGPCERCDYDEGCIGLARLVCASAPRDGPHGALRITRSKGSQSPAMVWGARSGSVGGFPDPRETPYTLCVFEGRNPASQGADSIPSRTVLQTSLPTGACAGTACWHQRRHGGFRLHDATPGAPIARVELRASVPNLTTILVSGHPPASRPRVLPLESMVTVQLWAGDACWTGNYGLFVSKNSARHFEAAAGDCPLSGCGE